MAEQRKYYFMAGLPRSGSTVLSALLNQNPRIHSGPSSPVVGIMLTLENMISQDELFRAYPKVPQISNLISNVINFYYGDVDKPVVIDKNRSWVNRMHYIPGYFGVEPKVICPVRNIDEILTSFIMMLRRNPYEVNGRINFLDEMLIKTNTLLTDDNRCRLLASPDGILGQSYNGIKQALVEGRQKQIHFVEYDDLMTSPKETMKKLYDFLEEDSFEHDFENIVNIHKEDDASVYGFSDMHDVKLKLGKSDYNPREILSEEILENCKDAEFWRSATQELSEEEYNADFDDNKLIGG